MSSKTYSLEGKALKLDGAADIEPYLDELRKNNDVEEILLQGNTVGIEASKALADVLKTKTKLKHANLADIYTGRLREEIPASLSHLLTALLNLPNLTTINLSDNAFGLLTEAPLVAFLSSHTPLQHLILNNNGLGPFAGTSIANALAELATKKSDTDPKLETVICGRNRLESGSMDAWAKAYAAHKHVKVVRMVQNGIRQEGIEKLLADGLSHCSTIEIMDLQDNTFTLRGANALTKVLPKWGSIQELGVGDCLLGARGGVKLAEALALKHNESLHTIRLQYNDITIAGVKALVTAVKSSLPNVKKIELNGNKFSEDDAAIEELREHLTENGGELDELDELEEEESDEEEEEDDEVAEDDDDEEVEKKEEKQDVVKDAEQEENANVALEKDKDVDALADILGKTSIDSEKK